MANKAKDGKAPLYLSAKRELLQRASSLCGADKALPPERELAQILGVGRSTLRRAIDDLIDEAFIVNIPRRGNFLSGAAPRLQLAVMIDKISVPFPLALAGIMETLGGTPYWISVAQVNEPDDVLQVACKYGLSGAIWLADVQRAMPRLAECVALARLPLVYAEPWSDAVLDFDYVSVGDLGRERAEFMLARGHKSVIYAGKTLGSRNYETFSEALAKAGVRSQKELWANDDAKIESQLTAILNARIATGLVADGGMAHLERIFRTLNEHPNGAGIEIEVPGVPELPDLRKRYPKVRVAGVMELPYKELGVQAAKMLLRKLSLGCPQPKVLVHAAIA